MAKAEVDTDGIDEAMTAVAALGANIERGFHTMTDDAVDDLKEGIRRSVNGFDLISGDSDGTPLVESFYIEQAGNSWTVKSRADHAKYLEEGTDPHPIRPDDAKMLSWVPENPGDYPTVEAQTPISQLEDGETASGLTTWYNPNTGRVYSFGVQHPGTRPYEYITTAQANWNGRLSSQVDRTANLAILQSGFNRA